MAEYKPIKIADKDRLELNRMQDALHMLMQDIEKAKAARIEGMDSVETRCLDCLDRIEQFKKIYFPNKK